jgi:hypothetical protein
MIDSPAKSQFAEFYIEKLTFGRAIFGSVVALCKFQRPKRIPP